MIWIEMYQDFFVQVSFLKVDAFRTFNVSNFKSFSQSQNKMYLNYLLNIFANRWLDNGNL